MLDFSLDKLVVILVLVVLIVGPKRLPEYASRLARLVRKLRVIVDGAGARVRDELGPEFQDLDWKKLDPRQYDPRQIIRDSLLSELPLQGKVGIRLPNPFDEIAALPSVDADVEESQRPADDAVPEG